NYLEKFNFESKYYTVWESSQYLKKNKEAFSILNINIRSLNKNFENLKLFLDEIKHNFSIICITETWCKHDEQNLHFELDKYTSIHQPRKKYCGGGVSIFVCNSINYVQRNDLCVNETDCESLCIEIVNKTTKNIIINTTYRKPAGNLQIFKTLLNTFLTKVNKERKHVYIVGDINLDLMRQASNNVKHFIDTLLQHNFIPTINKPTRITKNSSTLLDNIITNNFYKNPVCTGIIKTELSDHFATFLITKNITTNYKPSKTIIYKRQINKNSIQQFQDLLKYKIDWDLILQSSEANNAYELFLNCFCNQYEKAFPEKKIVINTKSLLCPWMSKGLLKSSKKKKKLYEKFLKNKTYKNETNYKHYKNIFEKIKKNSKKLYYSKLLERTNGNTKKTWKVIKEIIGNTKSYEKNNLPKKLLVDGKYIYDKKLIAKNLNSFFVNIGPNLAEKIPPSSSSYDSYLKTYDKVMDESKLDIYELRSALDSLKNNTSAGFDHISVHVVKSVFSIIESSLYHIFNLSIKSGTVPEQLKIARVSPIFKSGDDTNTSNYRPISVLPCFSKLLERIMYNRLNSYLTVNNMLFNKQFGFKKNHSTDHALTELVTHVTNAFNDDCLTLGVFIDLSKAFDTVNHVILLKKLENYGIKNNNLLWFKEYLSSRKQFIQYETGKTPKNMLTCGVPQGSILGPLLFSLYINDLSFTSNLLNFILFADDSNLFYSHRDIKTLFKVVNKELNKINEWFICNKLSLNVTKTKYILFHKQNKIDNLPLKLPDLKINKINITRQTSVNFLGVILDENLSWKTHISSLERKLSRNIAIMYKAKPFLNTRSLKNLYFSFIHSYLTYGNIVWASTNYTKLKKIYSKQKHACRIVFGATKNVPCEPLFSKLGSLNVFKINIYLVLQFMYKIKHELSPTLFNQYFSAISHKYPTRYSKFNFVTPKYNLKLCSYSIQYRGPFLWKSFKQIVCNTEQTFPQFKANLKYNLVNTDFNILNIASLF
ncbi:MAG: hypothetical protein K2P53_00155, partial [Rickettsiales bacterium]|nr:hypothetical protein [Rickettsiales bacterium]